VVGFTTGSRGKLLGKTCEKRINNNNNNNKAFNAFSTKNSCTRNITHYKESATIRNLKPEWWGSPLVQEEKYQEKPVKRE
jgi:hypothetical protein